MMLMYKPLLIYCHYFFKKSWFHNLSNKLCYYGILMALLHTKADFFFRGLFFCLIIFFFELRIFFFFHSLFKKKQQFVFHYPITWQYLYVPKSPFEKGIVCIVSWNQNNNIVGYKVTSQRKHDINHINIEKNLS